MNPQENNGFFASWGFLEFALSSVWVAGLAVVGFIYKLTVRVKILEDGAEIREENVERRHKENIAAWNRIDNRVAELTNRLDGIVDGRAPRPSRY